MTRKPNFFIIGAPKCGTTSLATWLGGHPQIFMSVPKEIYYFDTDQNIGEIKSLEQYLHIFKNAEDKHLAVGEASVTYLSSRVAVKNILAFNPDAKFIVMLRNPVEMAQSLHHELLWDGWECIEDFEVAWHSRNVRELGKGKSGKYCTDLTFLQYEKMCKIGEQVERLLQTVDIKSVLFIVMDDLVSNSLHEYQRTLQFLGVQDDGRESVETVNARKISRNAACRRLTISLNTLKRRLGMANLSMGILNVLDKINMQMNKPPALRAELKQELVEIFRSDVERLSAILGRDLSLWQKK